MSEVTQMTLAQAFLAANKVTNGVAVVPKTFAEDNLPADIDRDTIKRFMDYRDDLIINSTEALSEVGIEMAKADAGFTHVSTSIPFFGDKIELAVHRQKSYPNPSAPGEKIVKHGTLDARYIARGAQPKVGELKNAVSRVSSAWAELAAK